MLDKDKSVSIFKKQLASRYFSSNTAELIFLSHNFFNCIKKREDRRYTARICNAVYNLSPSRPLVAF